MNEIDVETLVELVDSKINYYATMLNYPEAKTDLIIFIINLHKKLDLSKFNNIEELKYFTYKCLDNERKKLYIRIKKYREGEYVSSDTVDINMNTLDYSQKLNSDLEFFDIIDKLPEKQRNIIYYKFYLQLSDIKIAEKLHVSRQSVNKTKALALSKIKMSL